jgi:hypothetical protein
MPYRIRADEEEQHAERGQNETETEIGSRGAEQGAHDAGNGR